MKKLKVLIVDDHPLIINAYRHALQKVCLDLKLDPIFFTIGNIEEFQEFYDQGSLESIDLVILDISLPIGNSKRFLSGEDIGIEIRKVTSDIKIIISTSFNDNYRVHSILKSVDPDAFLVKNDLTPAELITAITTVLEDPPYYSNMVLGMLRKQLSNELIIDQLDRRILYELSQGAKMKDIAQLLPLSIAGVEKRKRNLKLLFDIDETGDSKLIRTAKEKGFI